VRHMHKLAALDKTSPKERLAPHPVGSSVLRTTVEHGYRTMQVLKDKLTEAEIVDALEGNNHRPINARLTGIMRALDGDSDERIHVKHLTATPLEMSVEKIFEACDALGDGGIVLEVFNGSPPPPLSFLCSTSSLCRPPPSPSCRSVGVDAFFNRRRRRCGAVPPPRRGRGRKCHQGGVVGGL
jgi:hypothetical protein